MLGHPDAEETRIGEEDVGGETAVIAVEEVAGDRGGVEDVFDIPHHLPARSIRQDEREVYVRIAAYAIIGIVVEDTGPRSSENEWRARKDSNL